jgi:hypothetical protein
MSDSKEGRKAKLKTALASKEVKAAVTSAAVVGVVGGLTLKAFGLKTFLITGAVLGGVVGGLEAANRAQRRKAVREVFDKFVEGDEPIEAEWEEVS